MPIANLAGYHWEADYRFSQIWPDDLNQFYLAYTVLHIHILAPAIIFSRAPETRDLSLAPSPSPSTHPAILQNRANPSIYPKECLPFPTKPTTRHTINPSSKPALVPSPPSPVA